MNIPLMPNSRRKLPNRRKSESIQVLWRGAEYHGTVSYFPDGEIGELFITTGKPGTDSNVALRDAAIAASLAFQYGCPISDLCKAVERDERDQPMGPLAALLDAIIVVK